MIKYPAPFAAGSCGLASRSLAAFSSARFRSVQIASPSRARVPTVRNCPLSSAAFIILFFSVRLHLLLGVLFFLESIRFLSLFSVDGQENGEKTDQHPEHRAEDGDPE
jgi:hypothetical protein